LFNAIAQLISALNSNVKKSQLAAGFSWGVLLGLIPAGNIFWIVLFFISFFFRHNHGSKILSFAIIKLLSPLIVHPIDGLGFEILTLEQLLPLFTAMYNMPFVPFTNFNNTLVMGGLAAGIILWLPVFILFMFLIPFYRNNVSSRIKNSKIIKAITKFPLFSFIDKAISRK